MKTFVSIMSVKTKSHQLFQKIKDSSIPIDFVVGMSRGGLIPAALIATELNKPLVTIYIDKQDNFYLDRIEWLRDKNVLFVDDVCRSGSTMDGAIQYLNSVASPKQVISATMFNITSMKKSVSPDFTHESETDVKFPWDYDR